MRRLPINILALIFSSVVSLEVVSYIYLTTQRSHNPLLFYISPQEFLDLTKTDYGKGYAEGRGKFLYSKLTGWIRNPDFVHITPWGQTSTASDGSRSFPGELSDKWISTFGDSYTEGMGVDDKNTWQAQLSYKTGFTIENFGVSGFGPDQGLLYFESKEQQLSGRKVVVLGLIRENINRIVNSFRPFFVYPPGDGIVFGFKPKFIKGPTGDYAISFPHPESLTNETEILHSIVEASTIDYHFPKRDTKIRFPYTLNAFQYLLEYGLNPNYFWAELDTNAIDTLAYILSRFIEDCTRLGVVPTIVMYPMIQEGFDMGKHWLLEHTLPRINKNLRDKLIVIDIGEEVQAQHVPLPSDHRQSLYTEGHASIQGQKIIANIIQQKLCAELPNKDVTIREDNHFQMMCPPTSSLAGQEP